MNPRALAVSASLLGSLCALPAAAAPPSRSVDLASLPLDGPRVSRIWGSLGTGAFGLPVAGGLDADGDGHPDIAVGAMMANAGPDVIAGVVFLAFGDGTLKPSFDSAVSQADLLRIEGSGPFEMAGSELWMDDVTGDGLGDLLIARQNFRNPSPDRIGAGALSILVGSAALRTTAAALQTIDLGAAPPAGVDVFTVVGGVALGRLGIWMRTGDVTGDGIADIVVGADQEDGGGSTHRGAVYVIRGGPHLATSATVDLAGFGATSLAGDIAKVVPPVPANHHHFGATCQIADLDGNGTAEVLAAAALNRAGATIDADGAPLGSANATGGAPDGRLFIAWDDNFGGDPWSAGYTIDLSAPPGSLTTIQGGAANKNFGEEILGGLDYDGDGQADLFVGDITGDWAGGRLNAGAGHVFFGAAGLKGLALDLDAPLPVPVSTFLGGAAGNIAADTALHGDFDGDGIDDLAFSSPHASPLGRPSAGALHVFFGRAGGWPGTIDLLPGALPDPSVMRIVEVYGALGTVGANSGDTLAYSAAAGDLDGDGRTDVITNEMEGDGLAPATVDTGNLIALSGALLSRPLLAPAAPAWAPGAVALVLLALGAGRLRPR